ncbi:MAG: WD40 repeat domain-containing protein, partial [Microcystis aeruginosa]
LRKKRDKAYSFTAHQMPINSVAITPDGTTLVSGSDDTTIKVWNLKRGGEPRILKSHEKAVTSVAITPNGTTLVSGSAEKTIKVWDLNFASLMGRSCAWVRAYLHNPNSGVREEDRGLCDGIGEEK